VQTLNDCFREAYESPEFTEFMETQGFGMEYRPAEEYDAFIGDEYQRFGELVESLGLREQ
jgi:tripartite-type tricarboxylate transporter receptor subunit TctC